MIRRVIIILGLFSSALLTPCWANTQPYDPPHITDTYDIQFGSNLTACLGDPEFFVPINISVSRPTVRVDLIITYDPTVITPTLLAPNMFFQGFNYDLSQSGKIKLSLVTDLPPPPYVSPIYGDTTLAWISFVITTRDIGYDYMTHLGYYEDPSTPYPDNFIVLNDNDRVVSPFLGLHDGDILLKYPLYGDINLNTWPFEIADAVLFLNYFNGRAQLTRCQLANSDCNRDGIQASIADLVYMLRVITFDSMRLDDLPGMPIGGVAWSPSGSLPEIQSSSPSDYNFDFMVKSDMPLGGASILIDLADSGSVPDAIVLDSVAQYMQMYCALEGNLLRITIINYDAINESFKGGRLFSIRYASPSSTQPFKIESADFSDNKGQTILPEYSLKGVEQQGVTDLSAPVLALSGYPNPFKGTVAISYDLPDNGRYQLAVYDILGRKVKNLLDDLRPAGSGQIIWDGRDESGSEIASGTYFVRLEGGDKIHTIKLFFLK